VRIQGFAQVAGDMAHGGQAALVFFAIALAVVGLVLYFVSRSLYLTAVALGLPVVAVIWQLGILRVFGYGIDPIAVPALFLVLAIGVSHGAHMALATARLIGDGKTGAAAARLSFTRLIDPGFAALVVAALGMVTLTIAAVPVIRELALSSAIGLAVLCLTHLLILPLLASFAAIPASNLFAAQRSAAFFETIWRALASLASPLQAMLIVFATFIAVIVAIAMLGGPAIGDLHTGAAALRAQSRYNQDAAYFQQNFPAGGDVLQVIASGKSNVCLDHDAVARIDDLNYRLQSVPGVSRTLFMAHLFRAANVSWNEGNPKFDYLPYDSRILGRNNAVFAAQRELTNADCSVMPLTIFLTDHRGDTIQTVMRAVEAFAKTPGSDKVNFSLAAGNAGVTGAANDAAFAAEIPVMALIYALVMAAGFAVFRSLRAVICIVPPLAAVSVLLYVAMAVLGIGLTPETLPVLAWSVVIGADYSFYLFARLNHYLRQGYTLYDAYLQTLRETGNVAIFIALALTAGVGTWMFAPLRYQVEIGMLLAVMFIMNMLAAILVQPAIMAVANLIAPPKYAKDLPEIVR
jgi:predicted RND superfamily exporter protein